jgi:hypothetical protein
LASRRAAGRLWIDRRSPKELDVLAYLIAHKARELIPVMRIALLPKLDERRPSFEAGPWQDGKALEVGTKIPCVTGKLDTQEEAGDPRQVSSFEVPALALA